ncbi:ATP-binding cassette domain-containing protein [Catenulispora yoronensis]
MARRLAEVGLTEAAQRRTGGFSRGMKQRLSLAAALVLDPELLILDEPTSALDPTGRADVLALISGLEGTRTVIFSSHVLPDVQRVAGSVGVLDRGRLLFQGTMSGLIDAYARPVWEVRVRGAAGPLAERLRTLPWVVGADAGQDGRLVVEARSAEAGELGLARELGSAGARLVSLNPVDADLETAFLTLTGERIPGGGGADD